MYRKPFIEAPSYTRHREYEADMFVPLQVFAPALFADFVFPNASIHHFIFSCQQTCPKMFNSSYYRSRPWSSPPPPPPNADTLSTPVHAPSTAAHSEHMDITPSTTTTNVSVAYFVRYALGAHLNPPQNVADADQSFLFPNTATSAAPSCSLQSRVLLSLLQY